MKENESAPTQDPLFQINFLLWLTNPVHKDYFKPILHENGFELFSVEQTLPISPEILARLKNIPHKGNPTPDVIISKDEVFLVFECKASMFGSANTMNDGHLKQCRSLLMQTPEVLSDAIAGIKVSQSFVLYLTSDDSSVEQSKGLVEIRNELIKFGVSVVDIGLISILSEGKTVGIKLKHDSSRNISKLINAELNTYIPVFSANDKERDIRFLYYIPWMPDSESIRNKYNEEMFGNRLLMAVAQILGPQKTPFVAKLEAHELLDEITFGIFSKWRNRDQKKSLIRDAKTLIKDSFKAILPDIVLDSLQSPESGFKVNIETEKIKTAILEGLRGRHAKTNEWLNPDKPFEPDLFDDTHTANTKNQ